ncbi:cytochrome c1 [Solimonas terrae]|uniref:Cytochrome c1 n=1 Tax=Solimonas terrae TaxID=1396819 RepID=A0A6M2BT97_9GAMM|nr:cytochrome c1 [Solimonas terrae]NGY05249.1 cytochrome c1 [Solimonas terrae]
MKRIKSSIQILLAAATLLVAGQAFASEGVDLPYRFKPDPDNQASVQRGARNFMNYCSACHSMRNLRYNRLGQDLGIPDDMLKADLMFTSDKISDHIISAMPGDEADAWFGKAPPDLTVESRYRGPDWIYNYLLTFYVDPKRPLGTNNIVLPNASMPDVLWELQGLQVLKESAAEGEDKEAEHGEPQFELATKGKLSPEEYKQFVADTTNFMVYAGEPGRAHRLAVGKKVLLFLLVFTVLAYLMKREWWKDVH